MGTKGTTNEPKAAKRTVKANRARAGRVTCVEAARCAARTWAESVSATVGALLDSAEATLAEVRNPNHPCAPHLSLESVEELVVMLTELAGLQYLELCAGEPLADVPSVGDILKRARAA